MMCEDIIGRSIRFAPYGVAFTKTWARRNGANPVWYVDQTPSGHEWLTNPLRELADLAELGYAGVLSVSSGVTPLPLEESQIARIAPFIEHMGTYKTQKEFWWEREWRRVGNLMFGHEHVVAAFVPEADHAAFVADLITLEKSKGYATDFLPRVLDPRWGLERMISALLPNLPASDVGPFPGT